MQGDAGGACDDAVWFMLMERQHCIVVQYVLVVA
jgi:hypothetical protein